MTAAMALSLWPCTGQMVQRRWTQTQGISERASEFLSQAHSNAQGKRWQGAGSSRPQGEELAKVLVHQNAS